MIGVAEFAEMKGPPRRGGFKKVGERKGSRKFVELTDGSIIKWWNCEWRFYSFRHESRVATSLQCRAMTIATENGRMVKDEERYPDFKSFAERMHKVVGLEALIKIVQWIQH